MSFAFKTSGKKSDSRLDCARLMGSMSYIMKPAQSNITFAINELIQGTSDPNQTH